MPLRASNYHYHELRPVVIVGHLDYLHREWDSLQNFPRLFVLHVSLEVCGSCVVLVCSHTFVAIDTMLLNFSRAN